MRVIRAPRTFALDWQTPSVFLAGSTETVAAGWRDEFVSLMGAADIVVLDPSREDWNPDWGSSLDDPEFRQQLEWEARAQDEVDVVAFCFDHRTKGVVSLMELGEAAARGKAAVYCHPKFWKSGHVEFLCSRLKVPQARTVAELAELVRGRLFRSAEPLSQADLSGNGRKDRSSFV